MILDLYIYIYIYWIAKYCEIVDWKEHNTFFKNYFPHSNFSNSPFKGRRAERVLWAVAALSAVFIAAEFAGGFLASSLAIMTDAGHMLSDLLSFVISIIAIRTARQPANKRLSFGYDRAEVLGAMISIIILWVLTTVLVLLAVERIVHNQIDVNANPMLITAGAGVGFNIIMAVVLHYGTGGHGHAHGGGHGHSHNGGENNNVNVRAALIHVIGDLIQSIGVLIAALVIKILLIELLVQSLPHVLLCERSMALPLPPCKLNLLIKKRIFLFSML
uniref:Zinc transporter 2 n=1 Tax=Heterorhabditis bacteriophora TaxID=37862 RepID=A0A1I7WZI7_HETBA